LLGVIEVYSSGNRKIGHPRDGFHCPPDPLGRRGVLPVEQLLVRIAAAGDLFW
jgi:hypothetical protein